MKRSFSVMEATSNEPIPPSSTSRESVALPANHFHLGGLNYVAVTFFSGSILIHLREYMQGENGTLHPTRKGITMNPSLWLSFLRHFEKEPTLCGEVLVLNDSLLIAKVDHEIGPHITFQRYFKKRDFSRQFCPSLCILSEQEFEKLVSDKDLQKKITSSVILQLFTHLFPHLVLSEVKKHPLPSAPPQMELSDIDDVLTTSLLELVKSHIAVNVNAMFECFGCVENYENQLGHECLTFNYEQKLFSCGDLALLNIDFLQLARDFVEMNVHISNYVNANFFSKLNGSMLIQNAKDLYIASDPEPLRMY